MFRYRPIYKYQKKNQVIHNLVHLLKFSNPSLILILNLVKSINSFSLKLNPKKMYRLSNIQFYSKNAKEINKKIQIKTSFRLFLR
jgi:intracellular sulfur oxidation DsrE/DsrF family protein